MTSHISTKTILIALAAFAMGAWITTWQFTEETRKPARPAEPPPPDAPPRLELAESKISFGSRFDDEDTTIAIRLANAGGRVLHVEQVVTNCGCFRVGELPKEIAPGGSAEVKLRVRLAGMSGKVERTVAIHTDDPMSLVAHVEVSGEAKPRLAISPERIELKPSALDAAPSVEIEVTSGDGRPLDSVKAQSLTPGLTATATPAGRAIRLRIDAAPFPEDFTGSVVLRRGDYERVLSVTGTAYRDVRVTPLRLEAGVIRGATKLQAKLVAAPGVKWRAADVVCSRDELSAAVVKDVLEVRIDGSVPAGIFAGMVTVHLEGATPARLLVPVTAFVER